jgi:hypothetical protein
MLRLAVLALDRNDRIIEAKPRALRVARVHELRSRDTGLILTIDQA